MKPGLNEPLNSTYNNNDDTIIFSDSGLGYSTGELLNERSWQFKNSEAAPGEDTGTGTEKPAPPLSTLTKIAYGAPNFAMTSLTMLIGIHGTIFYIAIGADVAFLAFFISIARSFDVITDPVMGFLSDSTEPESWKRQFSKLSFVKTIGPRLPEGRRRPYMLLFAIGYSLALVLLFIPPTGLKDGWKISSWFGFFYIIFYLFDTSANVPWGALGPELSDDPKERDGLFFVSNLFKGMGVLVAATLPAILTIVLKGDTTTEATPTLVAEPGVTCPREVEHIVKGCSDATHLNGTSEVIIETENSDSAELDAKRLAMALVAVFFAVYYFATMMTAVVKIREKKHDDRKPSPPLVPSIMATLRNKPFMLILPAWVLDMTAITMLGTMLPFFTEYVVMPNSVSQCDPLCCGDDCRSEALCGTTLWLAIGLVALMGANVVSMPFWLLATRYFGKRRAWLSFNLMTAVTDSLFVFVGAGDPKLTVFLAFLNGLPSGGQFLTESIVADVIDYDEFLTGLRSEGRFTIFQTFLPKLVSIPAQTIPLALLSAFGFVSPCSDGSPYHPQPKKVKIFIQIVFFIIPSMCAFASFLIKRKFPITESMVDEIRLGCAKHSKNQPAFDPVTETMKNLPWYATDLDVLSESVWKLDNFFLPQLLLFQNDAKITGETSGREKVIDGLSKMFWWLLVSGVVLLCLTIAAVPLGWLSDPSTSWIPSFSVILCGLSFASAAFNKTRLTTAQELLHNPDTWNKVVKVIDDVLHDRKGTRPPETQSNPLYLGISSHYTTIENGQPVVRGTI